MFTSTRPFASCDDSRMRPLNVPVNALVGSAGAATARREPAVVLVRASSDRGVPARAAQPRRAGPARYQPPITSGRASAATVLAVRTPGVARFDATRQRTAATTPATQVAVTTCIHATRASVPVPSPCTSAIGHDAYASQCRARHLP